MSFESDTYFMRRVWRTLEVDLNEADAARMVRLEALGKAKVIDGIIGRIPVAYGDGKKSPYGTTYADELTGEFS